MKSSNSRMFLYCFRTVLTRPVLTIRYGLPTGRCLSFAALAEQTSTWKRMLTPSLVGIGMWPHHTCSCRRSSRRPHRATGRPPHPPSAWRTGSDSTSWAPRWNLREQRSHPSAALSSPEQRMDEGHQSPAQKPSSLKITSLQKIGLLPDREWMVISFLHIICFLLSWKQVKRLLQKMLRFERGVFGPFFGLSQHCLRISIIKVGLRNLRNSQGSKKHQLVTVLPRRAPLILLYALNERSIF
jgi:hypothetical protein